MGSVQILRHHYGKEVLGKKTTEVNFQLGLIVTIYWKMEMLDNADK